jgi:hypothetical protein
MGAYLIDHPPARSQFAARTNWSRSRITGCTVLHSSEFPAGSTVRDLAEFIRRRADPGSYHDTCDVHGGELNLIPYHLGAYHDGTGSNGFAISLSFNLRTTDWNRLTPTRRQNILRAGARRFKAQQDWRKANGHPLTPLRRITKAQSDAGMAGFIAHGERDPGRRSDPGTVPPNLFPWNEFFDECRAALAGSTTPGGFLMALSEAEQDDLYERVKRLTDPNISGRTLSTAVRELHDVWIMREWERWNAPEGSNTWRAVTLLRAAERDARLGRAEIAAYGAALEKLADAVAAQQGLDAEELKAAVRDAIAESVVKVDVNVRGGDDYVPEPPAAA